jgi:hypothetical protein
MIMQHCKKKTVFSLTMPNDHAALQKENTKKQHENHKKREKEREREREKERGRRKGRRERRPDTVHKHEIK